MKKEIKLIKIERIRWSPEIEVELPKNTDAEKLIRRNRSLQGWEITSDGSLDNGLELKPKKSNKLYYDEESLLQLREILALLKVHRAKVTNKCGLHIHVDCSNFSDEQVLQIIKEFIHRQRFFVKRFKVNQERIEHYCNLIARNNLHKLTVKQIHQFRNTVSWGFNSNMNFRECFYLDEKYHAGNASHLRKGDFGTFEFRLYQPTLNYKELCSTIKFTLEFIRDSLERE